MPDEQNLAPESETQSKQPEAECIKVAVNIRPLIDQELTDGCKPCLSVIDNELRTTTSHRFTFDYVFGSGGGRDPNNLYKDCVQPLIDGLFKGYNATVLAYGQTGSGKTYTMGSAFAPGGNTQGVIPHVMGSIFRRIAETSDKLHYTVRVGFVELYKEDIRDLMTPEGPHGGDNRPPIVIREAPGAGVCLSGATEAEVSSVQEMAACLERGSLARATSSTGMNKRSSRSHAIFTITLEQRRRDTGGFEAAAGAGAGPAAPSAPSDREGSRTPLEGSPPPPSPTGAPEDEYLCAKIHLVDLAGSERAKRTRAEGQRLQEGIHINRGLLALGNVICALGDEERRKQGGGHVPYRDSKLTRLLQDSLGGNSKTVMIACVSPADVNLDETVSTLKYASRARNIRNKPTVNRDPATAELATLRGQLARAKAELAALKGQLEGGGGLVGSILQHEMVRELESRVAALEREVRRLGAELDRATSAMLEAQAERDRLRLKYEAEAAAGGSAAPSEAGGVGGGLLEGYLCRIQELEVENRALRGTERVTDAFQSTRSMAMDAHTPLRTPRPPRLDGCGADDEDEDDPMGEEGGHEGPHPDDPSHPRCLAEEHAFLIEQRRLGGQVEELDRLLRAKEEQMKLAGAAGGLKALYDKRLSELEGERRSLEGERTRLIMALQAAEKSSDDRLKSQQVSYRSRISELEDRLSALQRRAKGFAEAERVKSRAEAACATLQSEITAIRHQKVQLQRQMEQAARQFVELKRANEKEMAQLRREGQKSRFQAERLKALQERQQAVLRRKTEEAEAARRRLKELTSRPAEKRPNPSSRADPSGVEVQPNQLAPLLRDDRQRRDWVERELQQCLQWQDLQQVLEGEVAERAEIGRRLQEVRRRLSAAERRGGSGAGGEASAESLKRREPLLAEEKALSDRSAQLSESIADLQRDLARYGAPSAAGIDAAVAGAGQAGGAAGDMSDRDPLPSARGSGPSGFSSGGPLKPGDVRRWAGIKNPAEARTMLRIVFALSASDRERRRELERTLADLTDELEFVREDRKVQEAALREQMADLQRQRDAAEAAAGAALAEARAVAADAATPAPARLTTSQAGAGNGQSTPVLIRTGLGHSIAMRTPGAAEMGGLPLASSLPAPDLEDILREAEEVRRRLEEAEGGAPNSESGPTPAPTELFESLYPRSPAPVAPQDASMASTPSPFGSQGEGEEEEDGESYEDDESGSESDLDDEDDNEDEGSDEEEPEWDPNNPTPAPVRRRAARTSRGGRNSSPPRAPAAFAVPAAAASNPFAGLTRAEMQSYEQPVIDAINEERGPGSTPIRKATVKILKEHLAGKLIGGKRWAPAKKDKAALLADYRAYLGLPVDPRASFVGREPQENKAACPSAPLPYSAALAQPLPQRSPASPSARSGPNPSPSLRNMGTGHSPLSARSPSIVGGGTGDAEMAESPLPPPSVSFDIHRGRELQAQLNSSTGAAAAPAADPPRPSHSAQPPLDPRASQEASARAAGFALKGQMARVEGQGGLSLSRRFEQIAELRRSGSATPRGPSPSPAAVGGAALALTPSPSAAASIPLLSSASPAPMFNVGRPGPGGAPFTISTSAAPFVFAPVPAASSIQHLTRPSASGENQGATAGSTKPLTVATAFGGPAFSSTTVTPFGGFSGGFVFGAAAGSGGEQSSRSAAGAGAANAAAKTQDARDTSRTPFLGLSTNNM